MAIVVDDFEDLPVQVHGTRIVRPAFTLTVPSGTGTELEAVQNPSGLTKGVWVKFKWGTHFGESDDMTVTLHGSDAKRVTFVNFRSEVGDPCRFYDAAGKLLGTAALPVGSLTPVVCASSEGAIKKIEVSVAGGPGASILFDDFTIESA
ncbi:hypothetical protein [Pseudomonas japonica]|uniref:Uncharacterized protein n=1 Tax=Pseudomonas japonica TaxID=256466 RepID=A0A239B610_9PSED|nr:hypothetical protein [Pseudomonas japonica]SNS03209.1 hypothetical protein SAMN05444352_102324 [Pseudomonas japonica]